MKFKSQVKNKFYTQKLNFTSKNNFNLRKNLLQFAGIWIPRSKKNKIMVNETLENFF